MHNACLEKTQADRIEAALSFRMPFGKYKTMRLEDLPDGYIRWLSESCRIDSIATKADTVRSWRKRHGIEIKAVGNM